MTEPTLTVSTPQVVLICLTAAGIFWYGGQCYIQANSETQKAMNVRAQFAEREAYHDSQRTQSIVSLFTGKEGPIESFGCPIKGEVFVKTLRGKKRIC